MKSKLLLTIFFLFTFGIGFSQPYAPFLNNSSWNLTVYYFGGSQQRLLSPGVDVVIGSYTYRKITDPVYSDIYIREDVAARKVYKRRNNVDEILYDFSLPVGGTFYPTTGGVYTVTSITTTNVNGGTRRRFNLTDGFFGFSWIEGVGSPNHPLIAYNELPSDPYIQLSCSAQNGVAVYNVGIANGSTPTDCSMLGIDENPLTQSVTLSPNPFSTELLISSRISLNGVSLKVYNSLGQLVRQIDKLEGLNYSLNRDNLNAGLYFVQLEKDKKVIINKKIIVQ